jgi:hypothetical protein
MARKGAGKTARETLDRIGKIELEAMIEEVTVDAYGQAEQVTAWWFTALENHLALPFHTKIVGAGVTVTKLDIQDDDEIVAVCTRGRTRQVIGILDVPLPSPKPAGAEWLDAYGYWRRAGEPDDV